MLNTSLKHLGSDSDLENVLKQHEHVMICCGRMGPMCIPVYRIIERLESEYPAVAFRDMEFDIPAADHIKNLSECSNFRGLPFTVYFRKGKVAAATTSLQTEEQVREIIEREFS